MANTKALIFDLDGTLIDSVGDIALALNLALEEGGKPPLPVQTIATFVGDGAATLCARALNAEENSNEVNELVQKYIRHYSQNPVGRTSLCPGVSHVLSELNKLNQRSRFKLAICTNKPRGISLAIVKALGLDALFQVLIGGDDLPFKKPSPEPLLKALELLGVAPEEAIMIGDGHQDVECANNAGVRSVAIANGFTSRSRLEAAKPTWVIESMRELLGLIDCERTG